MSATEDPWDELRHLRSAEGWRQYCEPDSNPVYAARGFSNLKDEPNNDLLYLGFCGLKSLPPEIFLNEAVRAKMVYLAVNDNALTTLPPEIGLCSNLEVFDCMKNLLTALPPELGKCKSLRILNFANNSVSHIPEAILAQCEHLEAIQCANNAFEAFSSDARENAEHLKRRWAERYRIKSASKGT